MIEVLLPIFSGAVAISTGVYAFLTWKLVTETRNLRKIQTEPKIHISLESADFSINVVCLNIKNIGFGPAKNIRFCRKVISGGSAAEELLKEFTSPNFFRAGLGHLGPGQNIHSRHVSMIKENFKKSINSILSIEVCYNGTTGEKYNEKFTIDMSELIGTHQFDNPIQSIKTSLVKIERDFHLFVTGFHRVKMDTYSYEDRKREVEEYKDDIRGNEDDAPSTGEQPGAPPTIQSLVDPRISRTVSASRSLSRPGRRCKNRCDRTEA